MADKKKMGFIKKVALFGSTGFLGLLLLGFVGLYFASSSALSRTYEVDTYSIEIPEGDEAALKRGKYLVDHVMSCNHSECHRADFGGGATIDAQPIGRVYAPNLTAGVGSVTNDYTPEDWVRILRHGLKRDHTRALVMPSEDFWSFPDEDLAAVVAYIKSQAPVDRENEGHSLGPVGMILAVAEPVFAYDKINHKAERPKAERGPTKEWGKVMIGACSGCHGETLSGGKIPGGDPSWPASRNITPDEATGIGKWTYDDFKKAMTTGMRPDGGQLLEMMPWKAYAGMEEDDLKALWEYLQSVPAKPAGNR